MCVWPIERSLSCDAINITLEYSSSNDIRCLWHINGITQMSPYVIPFSKSSTSVSLNTSHILETEKDVIVSCSIGIFDVLVDITFIFNCKQATYIATKLAAHIYT